MAGEAAGRAPESVDRPWRVLRRLAGRHAGYFTTRQVLRTGCEARVRDALAAGTVRRAGIGILRLSEWPDGPLDEFAMWSAWFDGAVAVSHHSAADLHGIGRLRPRFLHLSVGAGRPPVTSHLVVLRRTLAGSEVESTGSFLVTTPVRTITDLAESDIAQAALDEVVRDAVTIGRCRPAEIATVVAALPRRSAVRVHRALDAL